jgi:hypothetical protein
MLIFMEHNGRYIVVRPASLDTYCTLSAIAYRRAIIEWAR